MSYTIDLFNHPLSPPIHSSLPPPYNLIHMTYLCLCQHNLQNSALQQLLLVTIGIKGILKAVDSDKLGRNKDGLRRCVTE